jgi:predicted Rossmann-fold nucleotide-binding protein
VHSVTAVISSIGVFCGSSSQVAAIYREAAAALGTAIARRGLRLVYGGGRIGLMGLLRTPRSPLAAESSG